MRTFTQKEYDKLINNCQKFFAEFMYENGLPQTYTSLAEAYKEFDRIFKGKCYGHKFIGMAINFYDILKGNDYYFRISTQFSMDDFIECYLRCYFQAKGYSPFKTWWEIFKHRLFGVQMK